MRTRALRALLPRMPRGPRASSPCAAMRCPAPPGVGGVAPCDLAARRRGIVRGSAFTAAWQPGKSKHTMRAKCALCAPLPRAGSLPRGRMPDPRGMKRRIAALLAALQARRSTAVGRRPWRPALSPPQALGEERKAMQRAGVAERQAKRGEAFWPPAG